QEVYKNIHTYKKNISAKIQPNLLSGYSSLDGSRQEDHHIYRWFLLVISWVFFSLFLYEKKLIFQRDSFSV
ncbi:hypothetical protein KGF38_20095, partial [Clostridioides sp. ZZV14-6387]|nr:hypothetical protein [Clostridioides sp. ZZV14-6387]